MSKVTNALKRAEEARTMTQQGFQQEIRSAEEAVTRWTLQHAPATSTTTDERARPPAAQPVTPSTSWEQAMLLVTRQLQECEWQAARQSDERGRLQARAAELDQLLAQYGRERLLVQQRLEQITQSTASFAAAQASLSTQVERLRECQTLAQQVRLTEQEFQASAASVARQIQSPPKPGEELSHYQELVKTLERSTSQFQARLGRIVPSVASHHTKEQS